MRKLLRCNPAPSMVDVTTCSSNTRPLFDDLLPLPTMNMDMVSRPTLSNRRRRRRTAQDETGAVSVPTSSMALLLAILSCTSFTAVANPLQAASLVEKIADYSCDAVQDACPTQFNGICEATDTAADTADDSSNPTDCGKGTDCYDCDQCQQFHADCQGCLEHGCFYCPGDATCYNSPFYVITNVFSHCTQAADFLVDTCQLAENFYSDPAYSGQAWVYDMIHVQQAWKQGYTGKGVRVRINDNGVEASHPEFQGRFDTDHSCPTYLPQELGTSIESHGTIVAAIVGGAADNGVCSVGIAPKVTLSSCYVFDGSDVLNYELDSYDISQNSFGIDGCSYRSRTRRRQLAADASSCPFSFDESPTTFPCHVCTEQDWLEGTTPSPTCQDAIKQHCARNYEYDQQGCIEFLDIILGGNCMYDVLEDRERQALVRGVTEGRKGKGIIYVFAAGNAFKRGDDTNFQPYTNSRMVISVGAVGKDKMHASYSTPGASLFISAPGGDSENLSNHITAAVGGKCANAGTGTSFACPVVSGVVALMLQANPDLTWRDVQYILAGTSQRVMDLDDNTNTENAAGYWHSNLYGFGIVDAAAAVDASKDWNLVGPEKILLKETGRLNLPIKDNRNKPVTTSVTIDAPDSFIVENVVVQLDLEYFSRGHLEITLTSPQGTESILHPGQRPENTQLDKGDRWKLLTVRNWGENPAGNWTLTIVDLKKGDAGECASAAWSMPMGPDTIDCNLIDALVFCKNGELDPYNQLSATLFNSIFDYVDNDMKATDACCSCGGGLSTSQVGHQLTQWTLVVFGTDQGNPVPRNSDETIEPSGFPTIAPTIRPAANPTPRPSSEPSVAHSVEPTLIKSAEPSVEHSESPSKVHSGAPTLARSEAPTKFHSGSPTIAHSGSPTLQHSANPTLEQSSSPTMAHSGSPTLEFSTSLSTGVSASPTLDPTSSSPGAAHSESPTSAIPPAPVNHPNSLRTMEPSGMPSRLPIISQSQDRFLPTLYPSSVPSSTTFNDAALTTKPTTPPPFKEPSTTLPPSRVPTWAPITVDSAPTLHPSSGSSASPSAVDLSTTITSTVAPLAAPSQQPSVPLQEDPLTSIRPKDDDNSSAATGTGSRASPSPSSSPVPSQVPTNVPLLRSASTGTTILGSEFFSSGSRDKTAKDVASSSGAQQKQSSRSTTTRWTITMALIAALLLR